MDREERVTSAPVAHSFAAALLERAVVLETPDSGRDLTAADRAVAEAELAVDAVLTEDGPLAGIAASAELTPLESRVLALSGAVELDRRLQRLVAHLTADPGGFRLELDLVARLLGTEALATLAPGARLITSGLLEIDGEVPFAAARVTVPRTVAWALQGELVLDPALPLGAELVRAPDGALGGPELVLVHGPDRVRRIETAIAATWGVHFLVSPAPADDAQWRALVRTATVGGLGVVLDLTDVTTIDVTRPGSEGLTIKWIACPPVAPDVAGSTFQRTVSPTRTSRTISPPCSSISQTCNGEQTTEGCVSPNRKITFPSGPVLLERCSWPPCWLAMARASVSPSPAPPVSRLRDVSPRAKGSIIAAMSPSAMPGPSSSIRITAASPSRCNVTRARFP